MKHLNISLRFLIYFTLLVFACKRVETNYSKQTVVCPIGMNLYQRQALPILERKLLINGLVNIQNYCPDIIVDLKYSSEDNFIGINLYGNLKNAYLQKEACEKLCHAQNILNNYSEYLSLIVFDAARPVSVQQKMWDMVEVPEQIKHWYVANPQKGSIHNYGMAVDVSIINKNGELLDMGTDFDYFGELAYPGKEYYFFERGKLDSIQIQNRELLYRIMSEAGFYVSKTEWWHYNAASLNYAKSKYKIIK
ncbi:MAG TPA: M15 family metallopeptidase [Bacteroidales bacterium]|nr:M15 family metallopeptidase [Bacteroidales bacterium]